MPCIFLSLRVYYLHLFVTVRLVSTTIKAPFLGLSCLLFFDFLGFVVVIIYAPIFAPVLIFPAVVFLHCVYLLLKFVFCAKIFYCAVYFVVCKSLSVFLGELFCVAVYNLKRKQSIQKSLLSQRRYGYDKGDGFWGSHSLC